MANFVRVKEAPATLSKGEYVIPAPSFEEFVRQAILKRPKSGVTTVNYLRELVSSIGLKLIGEDFDAMREVNVSYHKGRPFSSDADVDSILLDLFDKQFPEMIGRYVDYHVLHRPKGTELIYFLGKPSQASRFLDHGIHEILERDLDKVLGRKPKKVVGKPAISSEEANLIKSQASLESKGEDNG